jgi:hypothetical protein
MRPEVTVEVEFVAPEAEIILEGNCVLDSTGTLKILSVPDEPAGDEMATPSAQTLISG